MGTKGLGNLIGILELTAPERLTALRAVIPNAKIWLDSSNSGDEWSSLFNKDDHEQTNAILMMSEDALNEFEPLLKTGLTKTRRNIKAAQIFNLSGKLIAAAGACGTIAFIVTASGGQSNNALITSIITFVGTLLSLVVQFLHEDLNGAEKGVYKQFSTLKDQSWKVRLMLTKITTIRQKANKIFSGSDFETIKDANLLAGEVFDTLTTIGVPINKISKTSAIV